MVFSCQLIQLKYVGLCTVCAPVPTVSKTCTVKRSARRHYCQNPVSIMFINAKTNIIFYNLQ